MTWPSRATARPTGIIDGSDRQRFNRTALAVVMLVAALTYANAIANGFVLDDGPIIRVNPLVSSTDGLWRSFALPYWPESVGAGQYRPLGIASFSLDWLLSGGNPHWFHAVNILWHVAATVAVWALAAELLAPVGALIGALFFAVHPVHVEAVANVVGRLECMAAVFVVCAVVAHRRRHPTAPLWFALGLLSKENAIVFLGLAVAHDVLVTRDWRAALKERRRWYAGYAIVTLLYAAVFLAMFHDRIVTTPARGLIGMRMLDRLPVVANVIPHYVRLFVAPVELSASYAPNVIPLGGSSAGVVLAIGLLIVFAAAVVASARHRRWPAMAFGIVWIPITLAPVSNVFFPSVLLAERTLYLPSVGVCLMLGAAAERALLVRPRIAWVVAASMLVAFAARTWTRTPVWRDDRVFILTMLAERPESYEGHLAAGGILKGVGQFAAAEREFLIARRLFPRDPDVYNEAADLARRQGRLSLAAVLLDSARLAPTLPLPAR